jgi:predicted membrane metal-binding protein
MLIALGAAFVLALAVVNVLTGKAGAVEMLLYAAPFLAVALLLLSGRYVGEDRILRIYRALPRPRRRRAPWLGRPELPRYSALERAPGSLRGPPATA